MTAGPNQSFFDDKGSSGRDGTRTNARITEDDGGIRNLKASQSVEAAFQAVGIPSPPGDVAAIITNLVRGEIQGLPLSQVANMSPGGGQLATAATAAVNQFVSSLSPSQLQAVKSGVNPLDSAAMMKLNNMFKSDVGNFGRMAGRDADSGARYDGMASAQGYTQTQIQARDLAIKSGLSWAANNPELLRLGPAAIQALADVHLQKESYERFKRGGLEDKTIVGGARYAKKHHIDYNDASKAYEDTHQSIAPSDQKAHSDAVTKFYGTVGSERCTPEQEEGAKKEFNETMKGVQERNPHAQEKIEREQQILKTRHKEERADVGAADKKEAKNDAFLADLNGPACDPAKPQAAAPERKEPKKPDVKVSTKAIPSAGPKPS